MNLGRIKGPFKSPPFVEFQISPIGIVPKKEKNTFRMITHLSSPDGSSINDCIDDIFASVSYTSNDEAIKLILKQGKGAFMAKADIKSAFRLIPINPSQYHLLCFKWKGLFYHDCCLPMGARSSCHIFEIFSKNVEQIMKNEGIEALIHILDDFFLCHSSFKQCLHDLNLFESLAQLLNIPLALEKTVKPTQMLTFVGLELDTVQEEVRLPAEKIDKCKDVIKNMLGKSKCQLKELQSLLGLLNFACLVIAPGRAFLQSLYMLTIGIKKKYHFLRLNAQAKADLKVFFDFLSKFNGISFYREQMFLQPNVKDIFSDAAKSLGYGALLDNEWFSVAWPSQFWKNQNITWLELIPIVIALNTWGPKLTNMVVKIHTDNEALHFVINKQYSKEIEVKEWIRKLVKLTLKYNILVRAFHIEGKKNESSDLLSRLEVEKFLSKHKTANKNSTNTMSLCSFTELDIEF